MAHPEISCEAWRKVDTDVHKVASSKMFTNARGVTKHLQQMIEIQCCSSGARVLNTNNERERAIAAKTET